MQPVIVIGGGLAGSEAAWQIARRGLSVRLIEMKPCRFSPAHESSQLAELVCSNSLRSGALDSAVGLLKEEMRQLGSLIMRAADATSVPAGKALAVDRSLFAAYVTRALESEKLIAIERREVSELPGNGIVVLATGPLSSEAIGKALGKLTGDDNLAFYDAIAPIVTADSIDMGRVFRKSRWDDSGPGAYLNCPMNEAQYLHFIGELGAAATVPFKTFEEPKYFEGCLPVEVMLARGLDTLRFGPMKPVGLRHPQTGESFHAIVQLRAENREETAWNMVGFQTKLTYSEQKRVFRLIPGLEQAEFLRLGSIHRNTFINAPRLLLPTLQIRQRLNVLIAGQLSGVEGYVESAAMGLLAGINAALLQLGLPGSVPPAETAHGALIRHLTRSEPECFQPSNVNFGLFPPLPGRIAKNERGRKRAAIALSALALWQATLS